MAAALADAQNVTDSCTRINRLAAAAAAAAAADIIQYNII